MYYVIFNLVKQITFPRKIFRENLQMHIYLQARLYRGAPINSRRAYICTLILSSVQICAPVCACNFCTLVYGSLLAHNLRIPGYSRKPRFYHLGIPGYSRIPRFSHLRIPGYSRIPVYSRILRFSQLRYPGILEYLGILN